MKPSLNLLKTIKHTVRQIDLSSIRMRLTLGIATVSVFGMGSVALWTSWQMQQILVSTNKQNLEYIAERFQYEVEIYIDMFTLQKSLKRAVDNLTNEDTLLWLRNPQGEIIIQSDQIAHPNFDALKSLPKIPLQPEVVGVEGRYWVVCGAPFSVGDVNVGKIYLAQDITRDQKMLLSMLPSLMIASILAISIVTTFIAIYVQRSLQPLKRISQVTQAISADHLADAQIHLENAPTEVKELAQTFDQMLLRLHQAWENQRQFVSNVSHELRTPLTVVSGYLQSTLRRGSNLTEPQTEALNIAASEADSTIQLLQDLLELARADGGNLHLKLESFILDDLVEEVTNMARQYSNRQIKIETGKSLLEVKADRNRLKQVLINLVDNAVKYSPPEQPVIIKLSQVNQKAIIQVRDQGIGIPLPDQARIFERFYRVDEARSRSTGGTGLGLSIVKTLVEGMGGNVSVLSKLNEGSIFTVTLPISH